MSLRIGLDLESGLHFGRILPDLDLLDIAYGAVHGGAQIIMVPVTAFVTSADYTPGLFSRPGIPLFAVSSEAVDLDRIPALGAAPDRVVIFGDGGHALTDLGGIGTTLTRLQDGNREVGVFVEPEPMTIKDAARLHVNWIYFPTSPLFAARDPEAAEAEIARLTSASLAARHLHLRIALHGPTGRHLPPALAALPHVEEIYPQPDLWSMALRLGWERAVTEYRQLLT